uniref:Uncharacterized protein n=1 Tax=Oryza meridionalis TaxID=40149 RepID=A0A0E0EJX6_9ORYZ
MAAVRPSSSAPSCPGAGVATMAAGRQGRGDGDGDGGVAVGLSAAPATGDGVAKSGHPAS